ncbi:hypothetical protein SAM23877_0238 [Streptomyces ambofaciens ATCC 23877]|uniref:Uncharacterized protein n=1 Tax=Streptomyces ambofaciens (strain ATCC 23877 / 3486 / DSM 40053 / JCM 4204 / NBRC 12836 / NRRL B-2516) TaxID=278992 RepID=A0A0K2AKA4_STRA7|nr:hypothetical protein SAM23877_0238 [Streptomyces ambofaciens ATCC 23877]
MGERRCPMSGPGVHGAVSDRDQTGLERGAEPFLRRWTADRFTCGVALFYHVFAESLVTHLTSRFVTDENPST